MGLGELRRGPVDLRLDAQGARRQLAVEGQGILGGLAQRGAHLVRLLGAQIGAAGPEGGLGLVPGIVLGILRILHEGGSGGREVALAPGLEPGQPVGVAVVVALVRRADPHHVDVGLLDLGRALGQRQLIDRPGVRQGVVAAQPVGQLLRLGNIGRRQIPIGQDLTQQRLVGQLLDDPVGGAEIARGLQPEDVAIAVGIDGVQRPGQVRALDLYIVTG